jgi:hypothetical protein
MRSGHLHMINDHKNSVDSRSEKGFGVLSENWPICSSMCIRELSPNESNFTNELFFRLGIDRCDVWRFLQYALFGNDSRVEHMWI